MFASTFAVKTISAITWLLKSYIESPKYHTMLYPSTTEADIGSILLSSNTSLNATCCACNTMLPSPILLVSKLTSHCALKQSHTTVTPSGTVPVLVIQSLLQSSDSSADSSVAPQ